MRIAALVILFLVIGCTDQPKVGKQVHYSSKAITCLRDFINGEDSNGSWSIISIPPGSTLLQSDLSGTDNPCIEFDDFGCGEYVLKYKVTTLCCMDSVTINIINTMNLNLSITGNCN